MILDRDGTLTESPPAGEYLTDPDAVVLRPGMASAVARWNSVGTRVVVATNQRCVHLGIATLDEVNAVHERIAALLAQQGAHIDAWYICPHGEGMCDCRKPAPGLVVQALIDAGVEPGEVVMIGDQPTDIAAAHAAGVRGWGLDWEGLGPAREVSQ